MSRIFFALLIPSAVAMALVAVMWLLDRTEPGRRLLRRVDRLLLGRELP